jgi:hypothetical protein
LSPAESGVFGVSLAQHWRTHVSTRRDFRALAAGAIRLVPDDRPMLMAAGPGGFGRASDSPPRHRRMAELHVAGLAVAALPAPQ